MNQATTTNISPNRNYYIGVGRRKTSSATVYLKTNGSGKIEIIKRGKKKKSLEEYFTNTTNFLIYKEKIMKPLKLLNKQNECDLKILVEGGGTTGQSEAAASAAVGACLKAFPDCRAILKGFNLITKDSRRVERKKIGLKKARKASQFSKR